MDFKKIFIIISLIVSNLISQCQDYDVGDPNNDNSIDILDIIIIIDVIFDNQIVDIELIDMNFDSLINIYDIIILIERILDEFPREIQILEINFNFHDLYIQWESSQDYAFIEYNLYYSNFIDNEQILIYNSNDINNTSTTIENIILNEQNFFWIGVKDFTGCEVSSSQYIYELPYKEYEIDNDGNLLSTEFSTSDFKSADQCLSCHYEHYNEWFSSMHSYTMRSPMFFSYKDDVNTSKPITGERFCMQCHNPVSYLTGEDLSTFNTVDDLQSSDIAQIYKDGISCDVCHTMSGISQTVFTQDNIAANAVYKMYPLGNIKFGPIINPEPNEFHESYYLPTYQTSQMCLPCHDLVVRDIEAEITFSEWSRIPGFSMFGGVSCQECHMPVKDNGYHDHRFIGVDIDLSIPIDENELYSEVQTLLSTSADISFNILDEVIPTLINPGDTLIIPLTVLNLTAHNLPSGTSFNREAWVELIIYNENDIIFSSGLIDNSDILNIDSDPNLLLFSSDLYDEYENITNDITDLYSMNNYTLAPYQERYKYYNILIPSNLEGTINVSARLLFRPFKPEFVLEHHPEFVNNLPVFEITSVNTIIDLE